MIIPGCFAVICVIFAVLGIYWGSLWKVNEKIHNLNGWIVVSLFWSEFLRDHEYAVLSSVFRTLTVEPLARPSRKLF